jgi:hypothetical protein
MSPSVAAPMRPRAAPSPRPEPNRPARVAGRLLLFALTGLWTWWALAQGAFFETVSGPGTVALYAVLIVMLAFAPLRLRGGGPIEVAVLALAGLALWTIASIAWTPARDLALDDAQRTFMYAAAFAAGAWMTNALRRRMILSLAPLLVAGAVVCCVTVIVGLLSSSPDTLLDAEGTLEFPFGYRNAAAGFLFMTALAALALVARRRSPDWLRVSCGALATASFALAAIGQSRGSLIGAVAGVLVLIAASRERGRVVVALLCSLLPVAVVLTQLVDPFEATTDHLPVVPELHGAIQAVIFAAIAAAGLVALAIRFEPRLVASGRRMGDALTRSRGRVTLLVAIGLAIIAGVGYGAYSSRDDGINASSGYSPVQNTRFTYTAGLNRTDFWRVAFDEFKDAPILGDGAGGFRSRYLRDRDTDEAPRDAHSMPLEILGELGLPGLLLFLAAVGAGVVGALRSRRLGSEAATLSAAALAVGACWLGQGAVDWSWSYPGLCAPALALLGSACAPSALALRDAKGGSSRLGAVALLAVLIAVAVPTYISARLTAVAASSWRSDPAAAQRHLDTAAKLNPLTDTPYLVDAQISLARGEKAKALDSIESARTRSPEDWQNYLLATRALLPDQPEQAALQLARAAELNPRAPELPPLQRRVDSLQAPKGGGG